MSDCQCFLDDGNLRLAELDQILIGGTRMQAPDIQVCFAQLVPATSATTWPTAAAAAAIVVAAATGAWGCHLLGH